MSRVLRILAIFVLIYLIAEVAAGKDFFFFSSSPVLSRLVVLVVLVYVLFSILKTFRKKNKPASRKTWFYRAVAMVVLIIFFKELFGMISVGFFSAIDNFLHISDSVPPAMMWGLMGLFIGLIYGSFVAWKKYRLDFKITLIPICIFLLTIFILLAVNDPSSSIPMQHVAPVVEPGSASNISASLKKFIVNRWTVVDRLGKNSENFKRESNKQTELEFKKNGKCYVNENGIRTMVLYYTISPDGRSIQFSNPNNDAENRQAQIISITKNELIIKSELFQNDTAILRSK